MAIEPGNPYIEISIARQTLRVMDGDRVAVEYVVSTARNGPGELRDSECTPCGWHVIRACIGRDCPVNTVFVARRPSGEVWSEQLEAEAPGRDWILTRILWLSGLESGRNRGGEVDTQRRFIYIHGAPDGLVTGTPDSHGCVRMRNDDVMDLCERVGPGTRVLIA